MAASNSRPGTSGTTGVLFNRTVGAFDQPNDLSSNGDIQSTGAQVQGKLNSNADLNGG